MDELEDRELIPRGFLSFALIAQEIISIFFALYSYMQGEMQLATFYLGTAGVILICLGIYYIFDKDNLSRLLLAATLVCSFFYLLIGVSDSSALLWCLIIVPVIVGTLGYRYGTAVLVLVFLVTAWLLSGIGSPFNIPEYSSTQTIRFLSTFAILAAFAVAMDNTRFRSINQFKDLSSRVDQIVHQDQLTQLPNRHDMERRLEHKYQHYRMSSEPFSVLLADIDNFKFINDRYGHDVGDDVLHAVGEVLSAPLRGEDMVARWGGDEFMILLPTARSEAAVDIAERLRKKANDLDMEALGDRLRISLSVGVASIDKCTDIDDLISTAENGLYQAKHMGRDMVIVG